MDSEEVIFNNSAFKHRGVTKADILWAIQTRRYDRLMEGYDNKYLLLGFNRAGNPFEVMYNIIDEERINVFHAMPCRNEFLPMYG